MTRYAGFPTSAISQASQVTIGVFDGMHRGHTAFLTALATQAHAAGHDAVVVTFDPHPDTVIHPERPVKLLMTPHDRLHHIEVCGIDHVISVAFDHYIQAMSAADFMQLVVHATNVRTLWVGWDFALGRNREGTTSRLQAIGSTLGFVTQVVPRLTDTQGEPSSSAIRAALHDGDISNVNGLLGHTHYYRGVVTLGDQRGRTIGFPTANMSIDERIMLPKFGVYACRIEVAGTQHIAVTNIGQRPTFQGSTPRIEAHILDFNHDIYGQQVILCIHEFIRAEQRFTGIQELIAQIQRDVAYTRTIHMSD
ncbi:MAG: bifunctional riboflavin kinase/FAD synthetase [Roseiflexaceae bacterium]